MQNKNGDTDNVEALEEAGRIEEGPVEKSPAIEGQVSRRSSRKRDEVLVGRPTTVESDSSMEPKDTPSERATIAEGRVMSGLTVTELEMMPRLEQLENLAEIPVGGTTNIEAEVLGAIAGVSAQAVEGVASLGTTSLRRTIRERLGSAERKGRGVEVEAGRKEVILDISLRVIYGYSIPTIVVKVRQNVADRLLGLCGLEAKEINVRIVGIEFPDRMPGRVQ